MGSQPNIETKFNGYKIIKDAVHGYIYVDADYIRYFIDTPNFQRLKRLEQTNMRPLYPCAHHDRFIHSLGTFHLGRIAYSNILNNSHDLNYPSKLHDMKFPFEIACLLHDVGHAPFSHTFENEFYAGRPQINDILSGKSRKKGFIIKHESRQSEYELFIKDFSNREVDSSAHEKVSAIIVLTEYFDVINNVFNTDPYLIARMILGLLYKRERKNEIPNCFISLLNGKNIDVDKLDYVVRDQWATGLNSRHIDYERLLSSLCICEDENKELTLCFHKRAISELISVFETKKMISSTIHAHHQLRYDTFVLKSAIKEVAQKINPKGDDESIGKIITLDAIRKGSRVKLGSYIFELLSDDDLIHILKTHIHDCAYAEEWFYRKYRLKPLWKTVADYNFFFRDFTEEQRLQLYIDRERITDQCLTELGYPKDYHIEIDLDNQYNRIMTPLDIRILIKDKVVKLGVLMNNKETKDSENSKPYDRYYFLLYVPVKLFELNFRDKLIQAIKREVILAVGKQ